MSKGPCSTLNDYIKLWCTTFSLQKIAYLLLSLPVTTVKCLQWLHDFYRLVSLQICHNPAMHPTPTTEYPEQMFEIEIFAKPCQPPLRR